jgi:hypothetical protein
MQILQHKLPPLAIAINCAIVFKASESALQKYVCFFLFLYSPASVSRANSYSRFCSLSCLFSSFNFLHHRLNQLSTSSFRPSFLINLQFLFYFFASIFFRLLSYPLIVETPTMRKSIPFLLVLLCFAPWLVRQPRTALRFGASYYSLGELGSEEGRSRTRRRS